MDPDGGGEDQFYGDEEDYDDLYNDVNVGEGFHSSLAGEVSAPAPPVPAGLPTAAAAASEQKVQIPGGVAGDVKIERMNQPVPAPVAAQPPLPSQAPPGNPHDGFQRQAGPMGGPHGGMNGAGGDSLAGTTLFVGELHWWTTDADVEAELSKYGQVKEVRFFDEKASGKSKGYCQVDFFDPQSATSCKETMNGHVFNGRPCVVAYANPHTVRRMGEQQVKNNQVVGGPQNTPLGQKQNLGGMGPANNMAGNNNNNNNNFGRGNNMGGSNMGGNNNNNFGRGNMGNNNNWGGGRGNMGNRGPMGMRNNNMNNNNRGNMGRGMMNGCMVGPPPPMMHPGAMGFDPTGYMGRFGGFPGGPGAGPFPGMMGGPFPPVVAPHVNPAFFGRGMGGPGVGGMWGEPGVGGPGAWGTEENQSSYGDDAGSDQQYGDNGGGNNNNSNGGKEREWQEGGNNNNNNNGGNSRREKEYKEEWVEQRGGRRERGEERETEREGGERERERDRGGRRERDRGERERYREEREHYGRERHGRGERERDREEWGERGRSSGRSKSREVEYKRRRVSPD